MYMEPVFLKDKWNLIESHTLCVTPDQVTEFILKKLCLRRNKKLNIQCLFYDNKTGRKLGSPKYRNIEANCGIPK